MARGGAVVAFCSDVAVEVVAVSTVAMVAVVVVVVVVVLMIVNAAIVCSGLHWYILFGATAEMLLAAIQREAHVTQ